MRGCGCGCSTRRAAVRTKKKKTTFSSFSFSCSFLTCVSHFFNSPPARSTGRLLLFMLLSHKGCAACLPLARTMTRACADPLAIVNPTTKARWVSIERKACCLFALHLKDRRSSASCAMHNWNSFLPPAKIQKKDKTTRTGPGLLFGRLFPTVAEGCHKAADFIPAHGVASVRRAPRLSQAGSAPIESQKVCAGL